MGIGEGEGIVVRVLNTTPFSLIRAKENIKDIRKILHLFFCLQK